MGLRRRHRLEISKRKKDSGARAKPVQVGTVDMVDDRPWSHACVLGALMWARYKMPPHEVHITGDIYGIFAAARFRYQLTEQERHRVFQGVLQTTQLEELNQVLSVLATTSWSRTVMETLARRSDLHRDLTINLYVEDALVLSTIEWLMGGQAVLLRHLPQVVPDISKPSIPPVWIPTAHAIREARKMTTDYFVLVEEPLSVSHEMCIVCNSLSDPHLFAALASSTRCLGVVAHSVDGLCLSRASAVKKLVQVTNEEWRSRPELISPHAHYQIDISEVDQAIDLIL